MTPRPPIWIRQSNTPLPKGLSTALMSTGERPVTQTADVARKEASMGLILTPRCQLAGRLSSVAPRAMTTRKESTGQVNGLKNRLRGMHRVCQPERRKARRSPRRFTDGHGKDMRIIVLGEPRTARSGG